MSERWCVRFWFVENGKWSWWGFTLLTYFAFMPSALLLCVTVKFKLKQISRSEPSYRAGSQCPCAVLLRFLCSCSRLTRLETVPTRKCMVCWWNWGYPVRRSGLTNKWVHSVTQERLQSSWWSALYYFLSRECVFIMNNSVPGGQESWPLHKDIAYPVTVFSAIYSGSSTTVNWLNQLFGFTFCLPR